MSACPPKGRIEVPTSEETTVLQGVSWQSAGLTRAIMSVDGGDEVRGRNRRTLGRTWRNLRLSRVSCPTDVQPILLTHSVVRPSAVSRRARGTATATAPKL